MSYEFQTRSGEKNRHLCDWIKVLWWENIFKYYVRIFIAMQTAKHRRAKTYRFVLGILGPQYTEWEIRTPLNFWEFLDNDFYVDSFLECGSNSRNWVSERSFILGADHDSRLSGTVCCCLMRPCPYPGQGTQDTHLFPRRAIRMDLRVFSGSLLST